MNFTKVDSTYQPTTTSQPSAPILSIMTSNPTSTPEDWPTASFPTKMTSKLTSAPEDLQITSTDWEGITDLQPLEDNNADNSLVFENLWTKVNQARKTMMQKQGEQLCQAHNKYISQAKELDSMELTPEQRQHHHKSLEQHHKHIWYSISKNQSLQRVNFVTQEEQMFRQKLDELRKQDITWMPSDYNYI